MDIRGVTPIIGVIVLVAITVVLSTIITAYTLDMTTDIHTPRSSFSIDSLDSEGPWINMSHNGGDNLRLDNLKIILFNTKNYHQLEIDPISTESFDLITTGDVFSILVNGSNTRIKMNHSNWLYTGTITGNMDTWALGDEIEVWIIFKPSGNSVLKISDYTLVDSINIGV